MTGESPTRPGSLFVSPPVEVPAASLPFPSRATRPTGPKDRSALPGALLALALTVHAALHDGRVQLHAPVLIEGGPAPRVEEFRVFQHPDGRLHGVHAGLPFLFPGLVTGDQRLDQNSLELLALQ